MYLGITAIIVLAVCGLYLAWDALAPLREPTRNDDRE